MATEILMPALSPTMTEGTLAKWLKKQGDEVKPGDTIAEIETDKATMEIEAVEGGVLAAILVPDGSQGVKVNQVIALLAEEGETLDVAAVKAPPAAVASSAAAPAISTPPAAGIPTPAISMPPAARIPTPAGGRILASPLARRIAQQKGIDLTGIVGSGPNGRIVKADIDVALTAPPPLIPSAPAAPAPIPAPMAKSAASLPAGGALDYELQPHTNMRRAIARRLSQAKQSIPHFYLTVDCCLDGLLKLRADLNMRGEKAGIKLSVNDMIIRAAAIALQRLPAANAAWAEEGLMLYKTVDISVAVAVPGGLITPIVRNADSKGLGRISAEMKELAARAKAGKLKPEEFQGGTFSISNLGMFGIREFSAIINPPQSAILAIGAGEERAVVRNGALAVQTMMTCTLSVDHRVIDGALGAEWLQIFKGLIEDPLSMML